MTDDVKESEAWIMRQAERLSALMVADERNAAIPAYAKTAGALALVMAGAWNLPCLRSLAERLQAEHRVEHGGVRSTECEACGYFDGAVYQAVNGRQFVDDWETAGSPQ
jgi:hypothetical protein